MKLRANLLVSGLCLVLALTGIIYSSISIVPAMQGAAVASGAVPANKIGLIGWPDMSMQLSYDDYSLNNRVVNSEPMYQYYRQMRTIDWFIPAIYGTFLASLLLSLPRRHRFLLLWFPILAALCDYTENIILVNVSGAPSAKLFLTLQVVGVLKFAMFGLGLAGFIVAQIFHVVRGRNTTVREHRPPAFK